MKLENLIKGTVGVALTLTSIGVFRDCPHLFPYSRTVTNKRMLTPEDIARKLIEEGKLHKWEYKNFVGYVKTVQNKKFIDKIEKTYRVSLEEIVDIIGQESGFIIDRPVSKIGELGTSQMRKIKANELVKRISNPKDPLYFPEFDIKKYRFENLSRNYDLNTLLVAARIREIKNYIKRNNISIDKIYNKMMLLGTRKKTYAALGIKDSRARHYISLWKNKSGLYKEVLVLYVAYNGGNGALYRMKSASPKYQFVYNASCLMNNSIYFKRYRKILQNYKATYK